MRTCFFGATHCRSVVPPAVADDVLVLCLCGASLWLWSHMPQCNLPHLLLAGVVVCTLLLRTSLMPGVSCMGGCETQCGAMTFMPPCVTCGGPAARSGTHVCYSQTLGARPMIEHTGLYAACTARGSCPGALVPWCVHFTLKCALHA
jgi:hypothetical protein